MQTRTKNYLRQPRCYSWEAKKIKKKKIHAPEEPPLARICNAFPTKFGEAPCPGFLSGPREELLALADELSSRAHALAGHV
jgi:hypothetical protein